MKILSPTLTEALNAEVTTLAYCLKWQLKDGTIIGTTDHDSDLIIDDTTYHSTYIVNLSSLSVSNDLAIDNMEITTILDDKFFTKEAVLAGRFDQAKIELFLVDYLTTSHIIPLKKGFIGEITIDSYSFKAELKGMTHLFANNMGELYSPICRANFGDTKCRVNKQLYSSHGRVIEVRNEYSFIGEECSIKPTNFSNGYLIFTKGENKGTRLGVEQHSDSLTRLSSTPFKTLSAGDEYDIFAVCDKKFTTCQKIFNNTANFRGEPHVPGNNFLFGG
jgi:uncharacterized phage protein (TIGR02218 family)